MFKNIKLITLVLFLSAILAGCASGPSKPKIEVAEKKPAFERALLHTRLAKGYMAKSQLATARDELEKALLIAPDHSDSNYVMGLLMIQLNNNRDAEYYLERAVRMDRENSSAAHDFGMFLCQTGEERRSVDYFEIAAINPLFDRAELSYMRAGECLAQIDDPRSEAFLKKALSMNPRLRPALYRLAQMKQKNGENLSARAYIERYLAITKPQPEALLLAYQIESSLNANDVAQRYRKQILNEFPGSKAAEQIRNLKPVN